MIEPIASGREADVFALDDTRVLRRYRTGADVTAEAEVMAYAGRLGFPVPRVFEASGTDLVMERLDGPTLATALLSGSLPVTEGSAIMAGLLARLHDLPARSGSVPGPGPAGPGLGPAGPGPGPAGPRPAGLGLGLAPGPGPDPDPETIVHLDLHPENVMLTARGPMVIDWHNAGDGPADLDTAFTALILAQVAIGSLPHPVSAAAGELLDHFLALAPGNPTRLLDDAVTMRSQQTTLSPAEIGMLGAAAARVREAR